MFAYLFFGLTIMGFFTIIENIKSGQKLPFIKFNFILLLSSITIASAFDFLYEIGYDLTTFGAIVRLITTILIVNLFYLVATNKVPKFILIIELLYFIFFFIAIVKGYKFMTVHEGRYITELTIISYLNILVVNPLILISMIYNIYKILKSTDNNNLYQKRIKKWAILLLILFMLILTTIVITYLLYLNNITIKRFDSKWIYLQYRFILILFIFLRPKFMDEIAFSYKANNFLVKNGNVSLQNFEFLFYGSQYFLLPNANLEDFALRLNHTRNEVADFIKVQTNDSFIELLNKNRVTYLKELLKSKQHESFTIEALSEMSGFNNRQSMYNAFKKYEKCSPTEYISYL